MSPRRQNFVTYQPTIRKSGSLPATLFGLTLLAGLFTPLSIQNGARAAEGPNLVIVVDSSGSMWGRMGKITKAEAARNAVRDFVGQLPPQSRVGVMAYGHLQKQSCSAAKMISPIAKPDPAPLLWPVQASPVLISPSTDSSANARVIDIFGQAICRSCERPTLKPLTSWTTPDST